MSGLMGSLKAPKFDALEDIQKIHDWLIPLQLHIYHNVFPPASHAPLDFSWQLYTQIPNVLSLVDTLPSSGKLSEDLLWIRRVLVVFPYPDNHVVPDILIWLSIFHSQWNVSRPYPSSESCSKEYFQKSLHPEDPPKPELPENFMYVKLYI